MKRTVFVGLLWPSLLAALLFLTQACQTVPVTGRRELNLVSAEQEMQLGLTSFDQLKKETPINRDPTVNAMVQRVGKQIAQVAGKDLPDANWEFVVFESKEANAFCLPGGKVGVYTGILPITKTEAGLATVVGHEIGHAVAHHGAERMSHQMVMQTGGQALSSALGTANSTYQNLALIAYGLGTKVGVELPFDRKQESEADHIGLIYMARAGYDPHEAVQFWQRFTEYGKQQGGATTPAFLRTHPVDTVRIRQLQEWMPEAEAAVQKSPSR
jgi:metalloendopeptidase OMA1, mitochondrial